VTEKNGPLIFFFFANKLRVNLMHLQTSLLETQ